MSEPEGATESCSHEWDWLANVDVYVWCKSCCGRLSLDDLVGSYVEYQNVVKTGVAVITGELDDHRADLKAAAGECAVPIPPAGSDLAKLLRANSMMRRESRARMLGIVELTRAMTTAIELLEHGRSAEAKTVLMTTVGPPDLRESTTW